ncbi:MAG: 4-hydroxythreonine-4-phosphate dehydrogenase PdxA [Gammaproteobacteria bacterium]|nr:4-hydroxythreonine-4-phosphate dehydrogenase PdxA [Gammaproteobacteria bacterium]MDH5728002.1 4-hydroxythreonine-4-phosphate dehydrogenase PdxA [Gammaproteobacteria bacterium]
MTNLPRIVITTGEPSGIGPDICLAVCQQAWDAELIFVGSQQVLQNRAQQLKQSINFETWNRQQIQPHQAGSMTLLDMPTATEVLAGQLNPQNSKAVLFSISAATEMCLAGKADAMVTAPIHKGVINQAGIKFSGHTEFIAQQCEAQQPVMMLACDALRVALVTTHLPLKDVSEQITPERLRQVLDVTIADTQKFFTNAAPIIYVAGLNPHAGEDGHLGDEEQTIISPIIQQLQAEGQQIYGPYSADTMFTPDKIARADVMLTMYHDQGLPVLKHIGFGDAINITLGLPIIRTSVDHGTALQLAGSGQAKADSLQRAINTAIQMSQHQKHHATQSA